MDFRNDSLIRIVDDNTELLNSLKFSLEIESWKVECFNNGEDFLSLGDFTTPGCIILDIQMPGLSGIEIQEQLEESQSMIPIIFLSGHGNMDIVIHTFRHGAFDFLQKPICASDLINTIEKAVQKSWESFEQLKNSLPKARYQQLTDRQKAVCNCLIEGLDSCFIAERLGISPRTLQRHRQNVLRKLGVKTPEELRQLKLSGV